MNQAVTKEPHQYMGIRGVKVMLIGDAGTGKTHSLHTLVEAGYEVFAIFTENCEDVVADIPTAKLKWHYVSPSSASWSKLVDSGKKINTMDYKVLAALPHINRGSHTEFLDAVSALGAFTDDRTGESFGSTETFDTKRVVWLDSFSAFSDMAMNLIAGSKPIRHQGDYGVAMDNLQNIMIKLTSDLKCHVVVVGHPTRERDEVTGQSTITISTIGQKLAPKLPQLFTDVIHTKRIDKGFTWSTVTPNMTLKARNLPWQDNMQPSFVPLMRNWESKNSAAKGEIKNDK